MAKPVHAAQLTWIISIGVATLFALSLFGFAAYEAIALGESERDRLAVRSSALAATVTPMLWNFEEDRMRALLDEAAREPDIKSIKVFSENGKLQYVSEQAVEAGDGDIKLADDLIFKDAYVTRNIGRLELLADGSSFWSMVLSRLEHYAFLLMGIVVLVSLTSRLAIEKLINSPLKDLLAAMNDMRHTGQAEHVATNAHGDIQALMRGFNELVDQLAVSQDELQQNLSKLEEANAAKTRFLAVVSHELRTPLNGILGMAQLLASAKLNERERDFVQTIISSGNLLLSLVNDILDASQIEMGAMDIQRDAFDLSSTVAASACAARAQAEVKKLRFRVEDTLHGCPMRIGDQRRISQILNNLLGNAVKFTENGEVSLRVMELSPETVRIEVRDTGLGVKKSKRDVIFGRFRQADEASSRRHGGSGLGLSIVRDLVSLMGGSLGVESEFGKGSLFWVELPLERAQDGGSADVQDFDIVMTPHSVAATEFENDLKQRRVQDTGQEEVFAVVADDDPYCRAFLKSYLETKGYKVDAYANGVDAVERIRQGGVSISLIDMVMPVMRGNEAIAKIRQIDGDEAHTPIIAISGLDLEEVKSKIWDCVDLFVQKPFDEGKLEKLSQSVCSVRDKAKEKRRLH